MTYAPIALFTYSRADHTKAAVESLLRNAEAGESDLYIFSDGPKTVEKTAAVEETRRYIHTITGFKSINIVEREDNWGLANSLIVGITDVINKYGKVIVVEDDLILSPYFLRFMNEGLEKYENDDKVSSITGFVPSVSQSLPETYFLTYFHCWGWATWKRAWELLNLDSRYLLRKLRFKKKKFDVGGGFGNYGILYCQKVGLVDSWYIRLYASFFLANKLTLYPGHSLVVNIGMDGSGTHSRKTENSVFDTCLYKRPIVFDRIEIKEDPQAFNIFSSAFQNNKNERWLKKKYNDFKSFIRRLAYIDCK